MGKTLRDYQRVIAAATLDRNILAVLPTNSGKTLIGTKVIHEYLSHPSHLDKVVLFMAPTVILTRQQRRNVMADLHDIENQGLFRGITHKVPQRLDKLLTAEARLETVEDNRLFEPETDASGKIEECRDLEVDFAWDELLECPGWIDSRDSIARQFTNSSGYVDFPLGVDWRDPLTWRELYADLDHYKKTVFEHFSTVARELQSSDAPAAANSELVHKLKPPDESAFPVRRSWQSQIDASRAELGALEVNEEGEDDESDVEEFSDEDEEENEGGSFIRKDLTCKWPRLFFCTPQIAVRMFEIGCWKMSRCSLIVFDECHHSEQNEHYGIIMNKFYRLAAFAQQQTLSPLRPRILGLTASPLNKSVNIDHMVQANAYVEFQIARIVEVRLRALCKTFDATVHIGSTISGLSAVQNAWAFTHSHNQACMVTKQMKPAAQWIHVVCYGVFQPAHDAIQALISAAHGLPIRKSRMEQLADEESLKEDDAKMFGSAWPELEHPNFGIDSTAIERDIDQFKWLLYSSTLSDKSRLVTARICGLLQRYSIATYVLHTILEHCKFEYLYDELTKMLASEEAQHSELQAKAEALLHNDDVEKLLKMKTDKRRERLLRSCRQTETRHLIGTCVDRLCVLSFGANTRNRLSEGFATANELVNWDRELQYTMGRFSEMFLESGLFGLLTMADDIYDNIAFDLRVHFQRVYSKESVTALRERVLPRTEMTDRTFTSMESLLEDFAPQNFVHPSSDDYLREFIFQTRFNQKLLSAKRDLLDRAVVSASRTGDKVLREYLQADLTNTDPVVGAFDNTRRHHLSSVISNIVENVLPLEADLVNMLNHPEASGAGVVDDIQSFRLNDKGRSMTLQFLSLLARETKAHVMTMRRAQHLEGDALCSTVVSSFIHQIRAVKNILHKNQMQLGRWLVVQFIAGFLIRHPTIPMYFSDIINQQDPSAILIERAWPFPSNRFPDVILPDKVYKTVQAFSTAALRAVQQQHSELVDNWRKRVHGVPSQFEYQATMLTHISTHQTSVKPAHAAVEEDLEDPVFDEDSDVESVRDTEEPGAQTQTRMEAAQHARVIFEDDEEQPATEETTPFTYKWITSWRLVIGVEELATRFPVTTLSVKHKGLVFAKTRTDVRVIHDLMDIYGVARSAWITGNSESAATQAGTLRLRSKASNAMREGIVREFRAGRTQVLVATSVIEEGFDLPDCSLVFRCNPPLSLSQHIQSRGRARARDSWYILMHPSFVDDCVNPLICWSRLERAVIEVCLKMAAAGPPASVAPLEEQQGLCGENSFVSYSRAYPFLTEYVLQLLRKIKDPRLRTYTEQCLVDWSLSSHAQLIEKDTHCRLTLSLPPLKGFNDRFVVIPPIRSLRTVTSEREAELVRNALAIATIRKLQELNILDKDFRPPYSFEHRWQIVKRSKKMPGETNTECLWREAPPTLLWPTEIRDLRACDIRTTTDWCILTLGDVPLAPEDELVLNLATVTRLVNESATDVDDLAYLLQTAAANKDMGERFVDLDKFARYRNHYDDEDFYQDPTVVFRAATPPSDSVVGLPPDPPATALADSPAEPTSDAIDGVPNALPVQLVDAGSGSDVSAFESAAEPVVEAPSSAAEPRAAEQATTSVGPPVATAVEPVVEPDAMLEPVAPVVDSQVTPPLTPRIRPPAESVPASPALNEESAIADGTDGGTAAPVVTLYPHRVWYTCSSWGSGLLRAGGLMGFWRDFHNYDSDGEPPPALLEALGVSELEDPMEKVVGDSGRESITAELRRLLSEKQARSIGARLLAQMNEQLAAAVKDGSCCQWPALRLDPNPWRILQPMALLLKYPLAEKVSNVFYHAETKEEYLVEIEPIKSEMLTAHLSSFVHDGCSSDCSAKNRCEECQEVQAKLNAALDTQLQTQFNTRTRLEYGQPISWELPYALLGAIQRVNNMLRSRWVVRAFNPSIHPLLRRPDAEAIAKLNQANAKLSNLIPPFAYMAPFKADGLSLDMHWVVRQCYLQQLFKSANIRDGFTPEQIDRVIRNAPPPLLKLYEAHPSAVSKLDPSFVKSPSLSSGEPRLALPATPLEKSAFYCCHGNAKRVRNADIQRLVLGSEAEFMDLLEELLCLEDYRPAVIVDKLTDAGADDDVHRRLTDGTKRITLGYFVKRNVTELLGRIISSHFKGYIMSQTSHKQVAAMIAYNFLCRCGEPATLRMTHQQQKSFRFFLLDGLLWNQAPTNYYLDGASFDGMEPPARHAGLTLTEYYYNAFKRTLSDENSFVVLGTKIRQGTKLALFREKVSGWCKAYAPEFALVIPVAASIMEQFACGPAIYWTLDVQLKRQELKLMLDLSYSRALPPLVPLHSVAAAPANDTAKLTGALTRSTQRKADMIVNENYKLHTCFEWTFERDNGTKAVLRRPAVPDFSIDFEWLSISFTASSALMKGGVMYEKALRLMSFGDYVTGFLRDELGAESSYRSEDLELLLSMSREAIAEAEDPVVDATIALTQTDGREVRNPAVVYRIIPRPMSRVLHSQVLEFVGDAVLKYIAAVWAYFNFPKDPESVLSVESDLIKKNAALRRGARSNRLQAFVLARPFATRANGREVGCTLSDLRGQKLSFKQQADVIEALMGATYWSHFTRYDVFPTPSDVALMSKVVSLNDSDSCNLDVMWELLQPVVYHPHWCGSASGVYAAAAIVEAIVMPPKMKALKPMVAVFSQLRDIGVWYMQQEANLKRESAELIDSNDIRAVYSTGHLDREDRVTGCTFSIVDEQSLMLSEYDLKHCWPYNLLWDKTKDVSFMERQRDSEEFIRDHFPEPYGDAYRVIDFDGTLKSAARAFADDRRITVRESNARVISNWFINLPADRRVRDSVLAHICNARIHPNAGNPFVELSNYERLEFLGDSALGMLIAEWLNKLNPDAREGALSWAKAILQ